LIKSLTTSVSIQKGKAKRGLKLGLVMDKTLKVLEQQYHPNSLQKNLEDWINKQRGLFLQPGFKSQQNAI
jgi:hypothetical protein